MDSRIRKSLRKTTTSIVILAATTNFLSLNLGKRTNLKLHVAVSIQRAPPPPHELSWYLNYNVHLQTLAEAVPPSYEPSWKLICNKRLRVLIHLMGPYGDLAVHSSKKALNNGGRGRISLVDKVR
jgi:hypothetical protein